MSFYRTYRPQVIDEIDNLHVREQILSLLTKPVSDLPHAYLLTGPKGAGKTTTARILAKLYLCEKPTKKRGPCGTCGACSAISSGTEMDVLEIDAASNRGIDEIRELRDRIALSPTHGAYKIYIIDEVHMLTTEAFNALLKTLEEPPKHAIFILATTDPQKIPATILSRCIMISFRKATREELVSALKKIVTAESLDVDDDVLAFIAGESDGAFRDAVKLLEQLSFTKKKITIDAITDLLSSSGSSKREQFLKALSNCDEREAFAIIDGLVLETKDIKGFVVSLLKDLQEQLVVMGKGGSVPGWDIKTMKRVIRQLIDAYALMKVSPIAEIPLELAVLACCGKVEEAPATTGPATTEGEKKDMGLVRPPDSHVEKNVSVHQDVKPQDGDGQCTVEKLVECWKDIIEALKPFNHSVAGVMRSAHPVSIDGGIVTIGTQYKFHHERLSESKVRDMLSTVLKQLFGIHVRVEIVLEKK